MNWDLVVIFGSVVALAAIRGHYKRDARSGAGLDSGDQAALSTAADLARRLEARIETLERVLDEDVPGWRARSRS